MNIAQELNQIRENTEAVQVLFLVIVQFQAMLLPKATAVAVSVQITVAAVAVAVEEIAEAGLNRHTKITE